MQFRVVIGTVIAMVLTAGSGPGQGASPVKIGVLTDMSAVYATHGARISRGCAHGDR